MLFAALVFLAGCAAARAATVGGGGIGAGNACGGPGEFAYVGETSLAALGLADDAGVMGGDAERVGSVWFSPDGGDPAAQSRLVCIQYDDGSVMVTGVDSSWQPPGAPSAPGDGSAAGVPMPIILVGGGAVVIIGFSIVAFRRESVG